MFTAMQTYDGNLYSLSKTQCKFCTGNKHVPALLVAHYEMINKGKLKKKAVPIAFDLKLIIDRIVFIELRCGHFFQSIK